MGVIDRTKAFIKAAFPAAAAVYRRIRMVQQTDHPRSLFMDTSRLSRSDVFSDIYRNNLWGDTESVSGRGSTLARTEVIREALPGLLRIVPGLRRSVRAPGDGTRELSLLDASCGDFNWMRHVDLGGIEYIGVDVVPELIARNQETYGTHGKQGTHGMQGTQKRTFVVADVTKDQLPRVDVILCRDCFIHLSFRDINAALINFKRSESRFLLATTHVSIEENEDMRTGGWRSVNLQLPPFNFPQPRQLIVEDAELGKCLGLWSLEEVEVRH